jgi:uncharacterized protein (DUF488 family)
MPDNSTQSELTVWTIGHSNHPWETFQDLLARHQIAVVADVRSSPYSSYTSQFDREAMRAALQNGNVGYHFFGDVLGGRPEAAEFYDKEGHVRYDRLAQSPGFQQGIERLLQVAAAGRLAILCGEEDPTQCHRRLLVARVLRQRGIAVVHIRGDGRAESEDHVAAEENFRKTKGQLSLFDTEDPEAWKSTQSVSAKKTPRNSSGPSANAEFGD